jgi:hypothetical protein
MNHRLHALAITSVVALAACSSESAEPSQRAESAVTSDVASLYFAGDSITTGFGVPSADAYPTLLCGKLRTIYGHEVCGTGHNQARNGAQTAALLDQVHRFPASGAGRVVLVITSGGDDLLDHIANVVVNPPDSMDASQMTTHIDGALGYALAPDRYGRNTQASVFEANIYDAAEGDSKNLAQCRSGLKNLQGFGDTTPIFTTWNGAIATGVVTDEAQSLNDIHALFAGHGIASPEPWFQADCIHPNAQGHAMLAKRFCAMITGGDPRC